MRSILLPFFTAILLLIGVSVALCAPKEEIRAMWVCRWDFATPEAIQLVVDRAAKHGYNALIVQVRGSADTLYPSEIEPPSYYLQKAPKGFDPLKYCIEIARPKGIRVHAWLNTLYTYYTETPHPDPTHITNQHPEWLMVDWNGKVIRNSGVDTEGAYTCPSRLDAREHVASVFLEVARKYDVDGIHFDFVRFPNRRVCYCDVCLANFRARMKSRIAPEETEVLDRMTDRRAYPMAFPKDWDQYRRDQVTALVQTVSERAHAMKPKLEVSASVFPEWSDAANERFQEWKRWASLGIVDYLCPMAYGTDTTRVQAQIRDAVQNCNGVPIWAGLGAWLMTPEQLAEKVRAVRAVGASGVAFFDSNTLIGDGKSEDYMNKLDALCFQQPAGGQ